MNNELEQSTHFIYNSLYTEFFKDVDKMTSNVLIATSVSKFFTVIVSFTVIYITISLILKLIDYNYNSDINNKFKSEHIVTRNLLSLVIFNPTIDISERYRYIDQNTKSSAFIVTIFVLAIIAAISTVLLLSSVHELLLMQLSPYYYAFKEVSNLIK